jgi:hypothetical protein
MISRHAEGSSEKRGISGIWRRLVFDPVVHKIDMTVGTEIRGPFFV